MPQRRQVVPHRDKLEFLNYSLLAVSAGKMVVGARGDVLTWRALTKPGGQVLYERRQIGHAEDLDLSGDRLLLLGLAYWDQQPTERTAGIAWLGSLSSRLEDFRPVLLDKTGPRADNFLHCLGLAIGAARFLPDGSFLVVPGSQPGAHLFDKGGWLIRSWSNEQIGLSTDCSGMTTPKLKTVVTQHLARKGWLDQRRVLDDILPLPEGPGLLVRSIGGDGTIRWDLMVLRKDRVEKVEVPFVGETPWDRLRGDVRGRKIVLLRGAEFLPGRGNEKKQDEVLIAEISN